MVAATHQWTQRDWKLCTTPQRQYDESLYIEDYEERVLALCNCVPRGWKSDLFSILTLDEP